MEFSVSFSTCYDNVHFSNYQARVYGNISDFDIEGVAVLGTRIYVIGGNDGSAFLNSCEVYDPLSNKWSFSAPMNRQRAGLGADVLDGLLYVSGTNYPLLLPSKFKKFIFYNGFCKTSIKTCV